MEKWLVSLLVAFCFNAGSAQRKATTEDGKQILIFDNGTWKSATELDLKKEPFALERPPFRAKGPAGLTKSKTVSIKLVSASKNNITDDAEWFQKNQLSLPQFEVPNNFRGIKGNIPDNVPRSYKEQTLVQAFYDQKRCFFVYGKDFSSGFLLLVTNKRTDSVMHFLDFGNYVLSPEYVKADLQFIEQRITWAAIEDSVLYIAHSHSTYAASSKNMNAYITAINLKDYSLIWRSKPLVNNCSNFEICGDMIVCGYGFTAEPDFLYALDKQSGAILQTLPLKSGPSYIIKKNDMIFVRTYNTDYVFKLGL